MEINLHMLIFMIIAVIAAITDIIIYISKIEYIAALIISIVICIFILSILLRKKKIKVSLNIELFDSVILFLILVANITMFLTCDNRFDTRNYHIYLQENFFTDKINFDYFPGRTINGFLFPLGDRMFYIFRYFLGYRLGVILNVYTLIILYYQVKRILIIMNSNISKIYVYVFSGILPFMYIINYSILTYYIDNFSLILLLEMIYIFIKNINIFENKGYMYYIFLLLGVSTGIKLPNFIVGVVILLAIIINSSIKDKKVILKENIKKIKIKDFIFGIILVSFPFIIYCIDNYIQTGSPIFPYYNKVFKSQYFGDLNWSDNDFGIPNLLYSLIWPVYIYFNPIKGNEFNYVALIWGAGYIVTVLYFIFNIRKRNDLWKLSILGILLSIVWAIFLMGYVRYAIVVPVIYFIIIYNVIIELGNKIKLEIKSIKDIINFFCNGLIYTTLILICFLEISVGVNYKWNFIVSRLDDTISTIKVAFENKGKEIKENYEIDGVWGCICDNSAMISLIRNPDTPIYNLDLSYYKYSELTQDLLFEKIENKKIYTITDENNLIYFYDMLCYYGFEIVGEPEIYVNLKFQDGNNPWYICQIQYVGKEKTMPNYIEVDLKDFTSYRKAKSF